jgi:hypothetical protein
MGLKELSLGLGCLYAYICNCEQISHSLGLLHGDLFDSLEIADPVAEGVDDLDVLDVWDSITEMFHVVPETLIILLLDDIQGLNSRWTLVRALEILDDMTHSWPHELMDPSSK